MVASLEWANPSKCTQSNSFETKNSSESDMHYPTIIIGKTAHRHAKKEKIGQSQSPIYGDCKVLLCINLQLLTQASLQISSF